MNAHIYIRPIPSQPGQGRIHVSAGGHWIATQTAWPLATWHRGKPTGTSPQGIHADDLRARIAALRLELSMAPDNADPRPIIDRHLTLSKGNHRPVTIADIIKAYTTLHKLAYNTQLRYRTLRNAVGSYSPTPEALNKYLASIIDTTAPSTFNSRLNQLNTLLDFAYRQRLIPAPVTLSAQALRVPSRPVIFLTPAELRRIDSINLTAPTLIAERHRFLFQCLTGLRASDIANLTEANLSPDRTELTVIIQKTGTVVNIPLTEQARSHLPHFLGQPCPPTPTRDRYIKRIAQRACIDTLIPRPDKHGRPTTEIAHKWELLSTHTARRTFICNLIASGASLPVIMLMTGHQSAASIAPYVAAASPTKLQAVENLKY